MDKKPAKLTSKRLPGEKKRPRVITRKYLENAALYYLQRYASSAQNLKRVLLRKVKRSSDFHKTPPEPFYPVIDELIVRYLATGLLDDKTFARNKTSSLRRQGKSRRAIEARLRAKGLSGEDIDNALAPSPDAETEGGPDAELAAAIALTKRRKLGPWRGKPLKDPKDAQKEMAVLGRAGFSYETARAALSYKEEDDDA